MKIKDIAKAFDMSVTQFADSVGCSKTALYCADLRAKRLGQITSLLHKRNRSMLERERRMAEQRYINRDMAIQGFKQIMLKGRLRDG